MTEPTPDQTPTPMDTRPSNPMPGAVPDMSPPEPDIIQAPARFWRNLSLVWLIPVLALVISLGIAWKSYADRGTLIQITFLNAAGIVPGETVVRFRDVQIGNVETVNFSDDLSSVIVSARIDNQVATALGGQAEFWVVRPIVNASGISGLSTVLSGVYIDAAFKPGTGAVKNSYKGLETPPLVRPGRVGTRITIQSNTGNRISAGAPVFYRGIEVGRMETPRLSESGDSVLVDAFIAAPHDKLLTSASRFWDMSGFSVSLGAGGVELNVGSLAALVTGGVSFDTILSDGKPLTESMSFELFADEASARESVFKLVGANSVKLSVEFEGSVSGLSAGAAVMYRGLRIGEVTGIGAFTQDTPRGKIVKLRTTITIDPQSLGLPPDADEATTMALMDDAVQSGLRARLTSTSIFSAALIIELAELPDALPATIVPSPNGYPVMPSVPSNLKDFTATAEGVLNRVNALPIEELLDQAMSLMASVESLVSLDGTRAAPDAFVALMDQTRELVGSEATKALPEELRATIAELRGVVTDLKASGALDRLTSALDSADKAAANIATASTDFPALVTDLRDLAAKASALKAEDLVASATRVIDSANALIDTDDARALPPALTSALGEVQAALAELRAGGAVENTNAALASARAAADAVAAAAANLPDLTAKLDSLADQADSLLAAYGSRSDFNKETVATLRDVSKAARAIAQLARTIERNPNSLLLGR